MKFQSILERTKDQFMSQGNDWPELVGLLLYSLILIVFILVVRFLVLRVVLRRTSDRLERQRWRLTSMYISFFLTLLLLTPVWLSSLSGVLAILGLFGAGVLIVTKEPILNIVAWFYIMTRRPFTMGHRVAVGDLIGDVIEIRLLDFTMIEVLPRERGGQSTGRIMHVPNGLVFTTATANSSKEFSFNWNEVLVPLTPESDWKKAEQILLTIANKTIEAISREDQRIRHAEEVHAIQYTMLTPSVYIEFRAGAVVLFLRHLTEPRRVRDMTDRIWRAILTQFAEEPNITLNTEASE